MCHALPHVFLAGAVLGRSVALPTAFCIHRTYPAWAVHAALAQTRCIALIRPLAVQRGRGRSAASHLHPAMATLAWAAVSPGVSGPHLGQKCMHGDLATQQAGRVHRIYFVWPCHMMMRTCGAELGPWRGVAGTAPIQHHRRPHLCVSVYAHPSPPRGPLHTHTLLPALPAPLSTFRAAVSSAASLGCSVFVGAVPTRAIQDLHGRIKRQAHQHSRGAAGR